jgi:hypothetical protein
MYNGLAPVMQTPRREQLVETVSQPDAFCIEVPVSLLFCYDARQKALL